MSAQRAFFRDQQTLQLYGSVAAAPSPSPVMWLLPPVPVQHAQAVDSIFDRMLACIEARRLIHLVESSDGDGHSSWAIAGQLSDVEKAAKSARLKLAARISNE